MVVCVSMIYLPGSPVWAPIDGRAQATLSHELTKIDQLSRRLDVAVLTPPAAGSTASDDLTDRMRAYAYDHAATAMRASLDHLRAWRTLLVACEMPMRAHLSLLRTGHEAALLACWLAEPTIDADTRLARGVAAQAADYEERRKFEDAIGMRVATPPGKLASDRLSDLMAAASGRGLVRPNRKGDHVLAVVVPATVELFDLYEPVRSGAKAQFLYRLYSVRPRQAVGVDAGRPTAGAARPIRTHSGAGPGKRSRGRRGDTARGQRSTASSCCVRTTSGRPGRVEVTGEPGVGGLVRFGRSDAPLGPNDRAGAGAVGDRPTARRTAHFRSREASRRRAHSGPLRQRRRHCGTGHLALAARLDATAQSGEFAQPGQWPGVDDVVGDEPPLLGGADPVAQVAEVDGGVRVGVDGEHHAVAFGPQDQLVGQVGEAVDFQAVIPGQRARGAGVAGAPRPLRSPDRRTYSESISLMLARSSGPSMAR